VITGHFAIASAAASLPRRRTSTFAFLALCAASLAPDVVDVFYSLTGICSPYGLYSHTIHAVVLQAAVVGGIAYLASGSRATTALFVAVVLLHIPADYFTGHKLLMPGGEMVGLQLYDVPLYDFLLEAPILVVGWWLLRRSDRAPRWTASPWALVALLLVQGTFDALKVGEGGRLKPSRCFGPVGPPFQSGPFTVRTTN
jgi:hypothetical protein